MTPAGGPATSRPSCLRPAQPRTRASCFLRYTPAAVAALRALDACLLARADVPVGRGVGLAPIDVRLTPLE